MWDAIVFTKSDLNDNNWLFQHKDEIVIRNAKEQWKMLKSFDNYIPILTEIDEIKA